jgi:predicted Zn-dependent peptidase
MRLVRAAILAGALLPQAAGAQVAAASPLAPDTVLEPAGGPRIVLLASPGVGVAALRLAVPLREGAAEAGAGRLLRDLALERMRSLARPVGARVSAARTPWGLAYSVVGATADFEYLAYLLREAVAAPDVTGPAFAEARLRIQGEAAAALETPSRRVAAALRAQAAPGLPPLEGTPASVQALDPARVRQVWLRSHQASAMTLVVSAPLVPEVVLAATRGMGAPEEAAAPPADAPVPGPPRTAAPPPLRVWYGEAVLIPGLRDPRGAVVASLVADRLRDSTAGMEATVELWDLPSGSVLALIASAWTANSQSMRRSVSGALARTRDALDETAAAGAVARARRELMLAASTPEGLVATVGRAMEADGDPHSAAREMAALQAVDAASVRSFLDELVRQRPRTAEVRP